MIAAHGGRYLARGGAIDVFERDWTTPRLTIVEFPTMVAARAFHLSWVPEGQAATSGEQ